MTVLVIMYLFFRNVTHMYSFWLYPCNS